MSRRVCQALKADGTACQAPPLREGVFCLMHSPENAEAVAEGRKLGGFRRRRETTIAVVYDVEGLRTVEDVQRVLEVAINDTLGLENSLSRARTLAYLAHVGIRALHAGDLSERVEILETLLKSRLKKRAP